MLLQLCEHTHTQDIDLVQNKEGDACFVLGRTHFAHARMAKECWFIIRGYTIAGLKILSTDILQHGYEE